MGAVFACITEVPLYTKMKSDYFEGTSMKLSVDASGQVLAERNAGGSTNSDGAGSNNSSDNIHVPGVGEVNLIPDEVTPCY